MKSTEAFKQTIKKELDMRAFKNPLFGAKYNNPKKNLDDCISYILKTVQASGSNGFDDDEVYNMAVHYYSEEDIDISGAPSGNVVVNHQVKLSEQEIEELREKARKEVIAEEKSKMRAKPKVKPVKAEEPPKTLFG